MERQVGRSTRRRSGQRDRLGDRHLVVADELAEAMVEVADAAMLGTVSDRLASAKDSPEKR